LSRGLAAVLDLAIALEVAVDRLLHRTRRGIAVLRIDLDRLHADRLELGRDVSIRRANARPRIDGCVDRIGISCALERQQLEQDEPERVHVGARPDVRIRHLLRGDVHRRAQERSRLRQTRLVLVLDAGSLVFDQPREPPVEDIHLAEVTEHDVRGLEVAMDHATRVRVVDCKAYGRERGEQLALGVACLRCRNTLPQIVEDRAEGAGGHTPHRE